MSSNGAKFSFSFGGKNTEKPAGGLAPKSNLELLMAKAKSAPSSAPKAKAHLSKAPSASLFADDSDDEETSAPPPDVLAGPSRGKKSAVHQSAQISRAERRAQAAAQAVDQSIFDYDTHYDRMKEAERAADDAKKAESEERKPKYIESFLASAQTRKLDKLRAEEKMLEREREKEGDEFDGKEKFVTEAYKKQMEEVRKAEAEEKAREEALRNGKKGPGLTSFYKNMLDSEETKHAAAVAATTKPPIGPSLAIRPPTAAPKPEFDDEEEYDPFLAQEAKASGSASGSGSASVSAPSKGIAGSTRIDEATGKEVEINDEGEVVDKRSLLKAGLNIMKKPSAALPASSTASRGGAAQESAYVSRAVGSAASHRERMEREKRRLGEQMRELEEKKRRDEEETKRKEEEEAKRRREGDNGEAERKRLEAKERYLARKRAKEEEDAARKKAKAE